MKIIVAIKQVAVRDSQLRIAASGQWIDEADLTYEINEPDAYALEAGLQLKEAHGGDDIEREREEASLVVNRQPRAGDVVAAVAVAEKMFGAIANPFHRPAQPLGGHRRQRIFAIGKQLGAEAAADVGRDDAHAIGRQIEHIAANDVADDVAALTTERKRVAVAIVFSDDAAGIHVIRLQPLIDD